MHFNSGCGYNNNSYQNYNSCKQENFICKCYKEEKKPCCYQEQNKQNCGCSSNMGYSTNW